jgi:riboflavin synthase
MFTGIVQEIGEVVGVKVSGGGIQLTVRAPIAARELGVDDSVCISGVCQTVIAKQGDGFTVEAVEETLKKTTFAEIRSSKRVNIELPVRLSDRLGGHLVQGHVDCVGRVRAVEKKESSWLITVGFPGEFRRYVIPVGSIAIDGVSLTVASIRQDELVVSIIPHTLERTTLSMLSTGAGVNLEFDLLGKFIENLVLSGTGEKKENALTMEKLKEWGYLH